MVVLVIIGIVSAAVSLSIKPDSSALLRQDAELLAQLLQMAQSEAQLDGRPITWGADANGFHFSRRSESGEASDQFRGGNVLQARTWKASSVTVRIEPPQRVVLVAEWLGEPLIIHLSDGLNSLSVLRDAAGRIQIR
ncbi:GspH/FimT family pseudopilin [Pseudomonas sp. ITA]|uniref:GspH/FimT family pseudopilin n=1 Tax=Pseudomonas sp. ITA TaxID=2825841 RepID=UPI00249B2278|nr:GspH/FimT family pseudopilin [Pseudomonas sp. ITA]